MACVSVVASDGIDGCTDGRRRRGRPAKGMPAKDTKGGTTRGEGANAWRRRKNGMRKALRHVSMPSCMSVVTQPLPVYVWTQLTRFFPLAGKGLLAERRCICMDRAMAAD
jgi:hypothetical protein